MASSSLKGSEPHNEAAHVHEAQEETQGKIETLSRAVEKEIGKPLAQSTFTDVGLPDQFAGIASAIIKKLFGSFRDADALQNCASRQQKTIAGVEYAFCGWFCFTPGWRKIR